MNWTKWKPFVLPVALPLTISLAMALAGPRGPLGLTPNHVGEQTSLVTDVGSPAGRGDRDAPPLPSATPAVAPGQTPATTDSPTPVPAVRVPPVTPPTIATPPSPPPQPPTPGPTPAPVVTPSPAPVMDSAGACELAGAYLQAEITTVTVQVKSCAAQPIAGGWEVDMRIRHPGCAPLDELGLPCANSPLKLTFFVSDADHSVVAADAETQAILDTY